jgi:hypothetical protein
MKTLVERLRALHGELVESDGGECGATALYREAADEIERLHREIAAAEARGRAELATMREALRVCRDAIFDPMNEHSIVDTVWVSEIETLVDFIDAALSSEIKEEARGRAESARLIEHIWLHVTSDEDFDADELKRDIERSGTIDEFTGLLAKYESASSALATMREALAPFLAFADVLEPGNDGDRPWYSWVYLPYPPGEDDEGNELSFKEGMPDETRVVGVSASWSKVPATYVHGLRLGDFRRLKAALSSEIKEEARGPQWQPIETAPKDREFLVWNARRECFMQVRRDDWPNGDIRVIEPRLGLMLASKRWMPLPAPPASETQP